MTYLAYGTHSICNCNLLLYHVVEEIAKVVEDTGCLRIYQLKDDISESDLIFLSEMDE